MKLDSNRKPLIATTVLLISLQGCVSITGEPNIDKTTPVFETQANQDNQFNQSISLRSIENFRGTSIFPIAGHVSPNMPEHAAREALENGMKSAGIYAPFEDSRYVLDVKMLETGEEGALSSASTFSGITRDMEVQYVLSSKEPDRKLFNEIVKSTGYASCSNGDGCVSFYLVERVAAERSYKESFTKAINAILELGARTLDT
ncbi:hypothetical protein [Kushneria indalinina]|uniref:hypothetical protein n=1 Tax=Kushneria indalinina TaxID=184067 RepID=UPI0011C0616E|nr:hypothetical protein [Kushneria indalinina]